MNRTGIEYGTHHWPLVTGCKHGVDICAVSADCWARGMAGRFKRGFTPTLHPERLGDRMPTAPSLILVSFTGDMFGQWWRPPYMGEWDKLVLQCIYIISQHPEHSFLFLTKNPRIYRLFDPWPANCWLGMSLTGTEPPERQAAMWAALERVQGAGVRWLSYEPAIAPLATPIPDWVNWTVVGGWSGGRPPARLTPYRVMQGLIGMDTVLSQQVGRPLWVKNNLRRVMPKEWIRQELPQ